MKNSVKELTEGMQRLCAIANKIVAHEGEVSLIERDLLLEDLRRLYDVALRMGECDGDNGKAKTENEERRAENAVVEPDEEMLSSTVMATMAAMAPVEAQPEPMPEPEPVVVPEPEPVVEPEPEPVVEPEPEVKPEPEPVEQPRMEEIEDNGNSLLFDEVIIEEETHHQAAGTQASLLDYLKNPVEEKPTVRTLGEKLGGVDTTQTSVEGGLRGEQLGKKVSDLRTVININDKFSFMSELFHNNMKAYNDFILRLNSIDTRDEALMCVNEVAAQYKWDEGSVAVQSFYKVFDKKF